MDLAPLRLAPKWSYSPGKRKVPAAGGEQEEGEGEEEEGEEEEGEEEEARREGAPVCARRSPSNGRNFSLFLLFTNSLIASLAYQQ